MPPDDATQAGSQQPSTTFSALAEPRYRRLWIGGLVSFLSVQMQFIARGWLAYELTGSNSGLGAVYLGFGVPMLLLTPWGGVAADRLSKRRVLMACQFALAASSGVIALSISLDVISYPMLIASAVVQGAGFSFLGPARMAFTGELVGTNRLANAIVLQQMSMNGTRVFGPSLAGALIGVAFFGVAGVYYLTTLLMLAAMAVTFGLPAGRPREGREQRSPVVELADGVSYLRRRPILLLLVATSFFVVMIAFPYVAFLPTLADEAFDVGAGGYGLLSGASAVGAVLASLFIASRADGAQAWRLQTISGVGFGLGIALLAAAPTFPLALLAIVFTGAAASAFQSLNNALVLGATDGDYHGRIQSLMMLSFSGFGMAALPLGAVADAVGLRETMAAMGVTACLAMAAYAFVRGRVVRRDAATRTRGEGAASARPALAVDEVA
ncbi:MAG TPA: MFS transporter [Acidimicrobiales bacterium]